MGVCIGDRVAGVGPGLAQLYSSLPVQESYEDVVVVLPGTTAVVVAVTANFGDSRFAKCATSGVANGAFPIV